MTSSNAAGASIPGGQRRRNKQRRRASAADRLGTPHRPTLHIPRSQTPRSRSMNLPSPTVSLQRRLSRTTSSCSSPGAPSARCSHAAAGPLPRRRRTRADECRGVLGGGARVPAQKRRRELVAPCLWSAAAVPKRQGTRKNASDSGQAQEAGRQGHWPAATCLPSRPNVLRRRLRD